MYCYSTEWSDIPSKTSSVFYSSSGPDVMLTVRASFGRITPSEAFLARGCVCFAVCDCHPFKAEPIKKCSANSLVWQQIELKKWQNAQRNYKQTRHVWRWMHLHIINQHWQIFCTLITLKFGAKHVFRINKIVNMLFYLVGQNEDSLQFQALSFLLLFLKFI